METLSWAMFSKSAISTCLFQWGVPYLISSLCGFSITLQNFSSSGHISLFRKNLNDISHGEILSSDLISPPQAKILPLLMFPQLNTQRIPETSRTYSMLEEVLE
ncbi:hypothetical protein HK098_005170 [Nowakowskiella sp. JEL0407]|nr:hypothetical protein HK098_005163 [Nowakowskiella sp. JEL0407]KAJ3128116.1 hypothetical protein HK098_005170 [Nowakowskiella sp. JEL0407]